MCSENDTTYVMYKREDCVYRHLLHLRDGDLARGEPQPKATRRLGIGLTIRADGLPVTALITLSTWDDEPVG